MPVLHTNPVDRARSIARIRRIETFLDSAFVLPLLRVRAGYDGVMGLVPVLGNVITTGIALALVYEATRLGVRKFTLAKMLLNVGVDFAMGEVPIAGDIADFFFRANRRNLALLKQEFPAEFADVVATGPNASAAVGAGAGQPWGPAAASRAAVGMPPRRFVPNVAGQ